MQTAECKRHNSTYGTDTPAFIDAQTARVQLSSDVGAPVDGEQRDRVQWQRRRGDRGDATESGIGDPFRRLPTVAAIFRRRLLHPLHADRHSGKSHHGDRVVSH